MAANESGSVKQALDDAAGRKARGNSLFGEGKHDEAADEYNNALTVLAKLCTVTNQASQVVALTVALHSNLAACHQASGQHIEAAAEAQAALALDPLYTKGYARLCKAMYSLGRFAEAAEAMAVTVALLPGPLDDDMQRMYNELSVLSASLRFKLPRDVSSIACVASDSELRLVALLRGTLVAVIKPGRYIGSLGQLDVDGYLGFIGIGKVDITSGAFGHPIFVNSGDVYACHLNLVGRVMMSVACVASATACLTLVDCVVQDHKDAGVLVTEGHAILERCRFVNLGKQAVEVREGGSAELHGCRIRKCRQGVVAYGGARRLEIINCEIEEIEREGVLVNSENPNAATRAQRQVFKEQIVNPVSRAASEWAERTGILLEVVISSSVVKGSGYYGLSLDQGAHVSVVNSVLADNTPSACFVKGATTVLMAGCHIETGKNCSGLYVAINYGATVTANGNTFVSSDSESAIVEEMSSRFKLPGHGKNLKNVAKCLGGFSKPVIDRNNQIFVGRKGSKDGTGCPLPRAPTLEELSARGIGKWTTEQSHSKDVCTASDHHALARTSRRVCHDLQQTPLFYAIGNTFGYDLSMGQKLSGEKPNDEVTIRILLGACGDIRNVLKTVSSLQPGLGTVVQVMLNDRNVAILARDVLLLSLIAHHTSATDVVAIWANHALTDAQRKILDDALATLAKSLPEWLVLPQDNLEAELLEAFASWRDCTMTLQELLRSHDQSVTSNSNVLESAVKLVADAVGGHIRFDRQIRRHVTSGNVGNRTKDMQSANPTLLEAPSLQYLLYWSSSMYRAIKLDKTMPKTRPEVELSEILLQTITPQIEAVAASFARGSLRVAIIAGDVLEGMLFGGFLRLLHHLNGSHELPILFDFIDLSNVSDYVSMLAVVQAAVPLLKPAKHAIIHAQNMQWSGHGLNFNTKEPLAFLRCALGMDLETYQELLGMTVQVQMEGPSNKPVLHTQWKWDLTQETTWLTGAMVLLEVMAAAKLQCATNREEYINSHSCKATESSRIMMSGTLAGLENSSPLTMLHLLHLRCPSILMPIIRVLIATNSESYSTRKWELTGHAMFQGDPLNCIKSFIKLVFQANADFYTLLSCGDMPLCLTVSKVPLALGDVKSTDVLQLLETLAFFGESDRVEVMLQRALAENPKCKSYFMTLCVVAHGTDLQAVGTSVPWSELTIKPLDPSTPPIWTACEGRALLDDDLELIELMAKVQSSRGKDIPMQSSWKSHRVLETDKFVIVELLLPRPFPGADEALVCVSSSGASLTVSTKKKKSSISKSNNSGSRLPEKHVITLPRAVAPDGHITRISRKLGIMVVRLPKLA